LDSVLFLFQLALFSLCMPKPAFGFPFLLAPLPSLDMLGRLGRLVLLFWLSRSRPSFPGFCSARSGLLVLVIAFFRLLLFAFACPTLGWLAHAIGLFGPCFCHHVSCGDLLPTDHCRLDRLLACHQHALFASSWPTHGFGWPSYPSNTHQPKNCGV
jgi:hypothetical protein